MSRLRSLFVLFAALACATLLTIRPASADAASVAARGTDWLITQQQSDGSFELAGFPGFETPDAVLAIAERAQTDAMWSTSEALAAVQGAVKNGNTPLHALDDLADSGIGAGQAAKLIVLDVAPLGLDPHVFNPDGDTSIDLVATVDAGALPDGSYGAFNSTLYAALAQKLVTGMVPTNTVALVRAAQQANGGWNFAGDATGTDVDIDTTGLAIRVLIAAGATGDDGALTSALTMLATTQNDDGSWDSFGAPDPNSTAMGAIAIAAAGFDPNSSCWRDTADPTATGSAYVSPDGFLESQQGPDGRIASPNDAFGVNTFATSQGVQGVLRSWLGADRLPLRICEPPASSSSSSSSTTSSTRAPESTTSSTSVVVVSPNVVEAAPAGAPPVPITGTLPRTGSNSTALGAFGAGSLAIGVALTALARRRSPGAS